MWDIKWKATNKQTKKPQPNKNSKTQTTVQWLPEEGGGVIKGKRGPNLW